MPFYLEFYKVETYGKSHISQRNFFIVVGICYNKMLRSTVILSWVAVQMSSSLLRLLPTISVTRH